MTPSPAWRRREGRISAGVLLLMVLGSGVVLAQEQASVREEAGGPVTPYTSTPFAVFSDLEAFWASGSADSIIVRLSPDDTHLSFRRIGPRDGSFDHSQASYLISDLFEFARTDSFFFVEYEFDPEGDDPPRAVGHWYFKGAGRLEREARVTIELVPRDGAWAISSIDAKEW